MTRGFAITARTRTLLFCVCAIASVASCLDIAMERAEPERGRLPVTFARVATVDRLQTLDSILRRETFDDPRAPIVHRKRSTPAGRRSERAVPGARARGASSGHAPIRAAAAGRRTHGGASALTFGRGRVRSQAFRIGMHRVTYPNRPGVYPAVYPGAPAPY